MRSLPHPFLAATLPRRGRRLSDCNIHSCLAMPDKALRNPQ